MPDAEPSPVPSELLRSVVGYFQPQRVVLFGSRARGEVGPDSDIDLLVILDDEAPREMLSWRAVNAARRGYKRAVDIVPWRRAAYEAAKDVVGSLPWTAEREGLVVYERH
jgi:predicted nucleotidyltransferase